MDVTALRACIQLTLEADIDTRRKAELDLKRAEEQPGFTDALLNILESEQVHAVRLATVLYAKNRVQKGWSDEEFTQAKPIPEEEKAVFRNRLVPILAASPSSIRAQLTPTLQKILASDFPSKWPSYLELTINLLNAGDENSVFAGVQCLLALCRIYRYKGGEARAEFDKIVEMTFPQLLNIGNGVLNQTTPEAGDMLHTVLKVYKQAIYYELPVCLREQQTMINWCTLFINVVGKDLQTMAMPEDTEDRENNHWWRSKKWAYANLNRLYMRYGNPQSLGKNNEADYAEVAKNFSAVFAPEIFKVYLQQIEKWVAKTIWLSKPCLSFTLTFLDECVKPKAMWALLKPHTETLIAHLVFPVLCQSDEDLELFESDPQEYLHRRLNFYEELTAPDAAATTFLTTLTKNRRKQTYTVLSFVNNIMNQWETTPVEARNPRQKEGALRMVGSLSTVLLGKKSPIADQMEYFFVRHVFPEFHSEHGFLRARACDTLERFEQLEFKDENNLVTIYKNILECMADPDLPVRVEAALALQPLIRHDLIRQAMQHNIPQVMQQLLKLANEVDVDALANVMEDFVEVFANELTPFAVALSEQLRDTYLRLARVVIERGNDDENGEYLDDKSINALGVLQTIGTLILTLESTPDVLLHLEVVLMPVITITLENKLYDLYNEVFEIIDSCTFAAKSISPTMWQAFELIHKTFKAGAELYLEDMLPALENFVSFGHEALRQNPPYLEAIVDIIRTIFKDDKVGGVERICGCKLAENLMLSLRGSIDACIPEFISLAMGKLNNDEPKVKSVRVHLMEMVINAVYYNPRLTLQILEANQWTNKFFSQWFANMDSFTRVHDKKLSIAAITLLLSLRGEEVPVTIQPGWSRLLQGLVRLFQTLPAALKNREEAKREDFAGSYDDDEEEDDEEWEVEEWEGEDEGDDVKDESTAYLDFLNEEAQKFSSIEDDDDLEEESLLETPLDKLEPYSMLKSSLIELQSREPQMYESLTKNLSPEEQQVLQGAVHQADAIFAAVAAEQAASNGALQS
ncbi:ARM repeat-containing protein [Pseudovirgaria hyperparasitica]|uniref:ARM repeat-containing protein n=1 Tax=Pseudovirgaria hyperparasitica TaxID=470096 RepID=A0A6A6WF08_9PEZI|nr:ARM repeat-containing protein [Pseudovirgaria hyperparasitica]KAF2761125.1 ARM repeat-containing protein [Pseudovirgaria hyperparasitica]